MRLMSLAQTSNIIQVVRTEDNIWPRERIQIEVDNYYLIIDVDPMKG